MRYFLFYFKNFFRHKISFAFIAFSSFLLSCAPLQFEDYVDTPFYSVDVTLEYEEEIVIPEMVLGDIGDSFVDDSVNVRNNSSNVIPFPIDNNSYVQYFVRHFSRGEGREKMQRLLERSGRYAFYMGSILSQEGLPKEFIYMSLWESDGFQARAKSSKDAVGYWQFIHPTAKGYGLKINSLIDERRDVDLSTRAAIRYLKHLYSLYGTWQMAMAGYNWGETRLSRAVRTHKTNNYWDLVQKKALPRETRNYVPIIMAIAQIARRPYAYGFFQINYDKPLSYKTAEISSDVTVDYVCSYLDISTEEFRRLNPKFKTNRIPYSQVSHVRVPN